MITDSDTGENPVTAQDIRQAQIAAANLRDMGEKHPSECAMVFRVTVLPIKGPQFMFRLEPDGWLTLKYFTRQNRISGFELSGDERTVCDYSQLPAQWFEQLEKSSAPVYAAVRMPLKNHPAEMETFMRLETEFQEEPRATGALPEETTYFIEMGSARTCLAVSGKQTHPELIGFIENFIRERLWFLESVFAKIEA